MSKRDDAQINWSNDAHALRQIDTSTPHILYYAIMKPILVNPGQFWLKMPAQEIIACKFTRPRHEETLIG